MQVAMSNNKCHTNAGCSGDGRQGFKCVPYQVRPFVIKIVEMRVGRSFLILGVLIRPGTHVASLVTLAYARRCISLFAWGGMTTLLNYLQCRRIISWG